MEDMAPSDASDYQNIRLGKFHNKKYLFFAAKIEQITGKISFCFVSMTRRMRFELVLF